MKKENLLAGILEGRQSSYSLMQVFRIMRLLKDNLSVSFTVREPKFLPEHLDD